MRETTWALSKGRKRIELDPGLDKRLVAYAACATCACTLVMAQSAEAKIVFTPVNIVITGLTRIDINGDGVNDFLFSHGGAVANTGSTGYSSGVGVVEYRLANKVIGTLNPRTYPSALSARAIVSSKRNFILNGPMANCDLNGSGTHRLGKWGNAKNKYLGLKFLISGQTHYGWARLSFRNVGLCGINAVITGYAYETVANKPILTGKKSGPEEDSAMETADPVSLSGWTLGLYARGAAGLDVWRRKEEIVFDN